MKKTESIIEYCRNRIRRRMYLNILPDVAVKIRNIGGPNGSGHYKIQPNEWNVIEPSEFWREEGYFNRFKAALKEEYSQLYKDTDRKVLLSAYLIEPIVSFGSSAIKISGGLNWVIVGVLKNGEKYCAVLDVEVRPLLRRCGLMTLMKQAEIELAEREKCDFIQTWHRSDNPDFNAAIVPGLKRGFILYHGPSGDGEDYEERGCIHLRYYFDRIKRRNVRVEFKAGKEFVSPEENSAIIHYLESCADKYPGRTIRRIEEYGQANIRAKRKKTKLITENGKGEQSKQRIYIAEGSVGFEYTRQRNAYRAGDVVSFCPVILIDQYEKSDQDEPYMKHVIYNIYEFNFMPISMVYFEHPDGTTRQHYVLEISPGLRLFYTTRESSQRRCLKVDRWYKGYGRLSIGDHRDSAYVKTPSTGKDILKIGKLISISEDLIQRDFSTRYSNQVKRFRYGKDVHCDEDALEWFGYYRDLDEFKINVASYLDTPVEYESTDSPEPVGYSPNLIFCMEINEGSQHGNGKAGRP